MLVTKPIWVNHEQLPIFGIDIHPDGTKFVTAGQGPNGGRVLIWSLVPVLDKYKAEDETIPKLLCELEFHACVNAVRWSQSGTYLCSGGDDKIVEIWKCSSKYNGASVQPTNNPFAKASHEQWRSAASLTGHKGDILDVSWSPNDRYLASASVDNNVIIWDALNFPHIVTTLKGHASLVKGVTWDPIGKFLASQSDDRTLRIWRTSDWTLEQVVKEPFMECGGTTHVLRLDWSPDGMYLVSAHAMNAGGPTAQIVERTGWKTDKDFVGHRKAVVCVRFNRNILQREGNKSKTCFVALGSRDRAISVWSAALKRPLVVVRDMFAGSIMDLSWSHCGNVLACCSFDGTVAVIKFTQNEIGKPLTATEVATLHQQTYGQNIMFQTSNLIQDVAILKGQQRKQLASKQEPAKVIKTESSVTNGSTEPKEAEKPSKSTTSAVIKSEPSAKPLEESFKDNKINQSGDSISTLAMSPNKSPGKGSPHVAKQIETVRNDGKRRITPKLLIPQDGSNSRDGNNIQNLGTTTSSTSDKKSETDSKETEPNVGKSGVDEDGKMNGDKSSVNDRVALLEARVTDAAGSSTKAVSSEENLEAKAIEKPRLSSGVGSSDDSVQPQANPQEGSKTPNSSTESGPGSATNKRKRSAEELGAPEVKLIKKGKLAPATNPPSTSSMPAPKLPASLIKSSKDKQSASSYSSMHNHPPILDPAAADHVGSSAPKTPPRSKLAPMKLDSQFLQVSIKKSGGYNLTVENRKKSGRYYTNNITCQHEKDSLDGLSWTVCVEAPICGMVGDPMKIVVLCEDSTCHILDAKGRYTLPPIMVSNFPHKLVLRDQYLMIITVKATLHMWNVYQKKSMIRSESLLPLLQQGPTDSRSRPIEISRCTVLVGGIPLIILSNGKSYKFSSDLQTWLLFVGLGPNIPLELDSTDVLPSSHLPLCNGSQEVNYAAVSDAKLKLAGAVDLKKPSEIRVCMHTLGIVMAREGLEAELRCLFIDLLGPCHSGALSASSSSSIPNAWVSNVHGVPKREMLRSILNDIVKDLRWQDLYCEFNELLETVEDPVNGMDIS